MPGRPDHDGTDGPSIPHDLTAERALLGAMLLSRDAVTTVAPIVDAAAFYRPAHGHIAAAIETLTTRGDPADPVTVGGLLSERGQLEVAGGVAGLVLLQDEAPGTANAASYARIVADHARARRLLDVGLALASAARTGDDPAQALLDAQTRLDQLASDTPTGETNLRVADIGELLDGGLTPIEPDLGVRTDGAKLFYAGCMHTLQAPPSTGKSWIALWVALEVLVMGSSVVYLDWEDSPASLLSRLLALGADPHALRSRWSYAKVEGPWGAAENAHAHRLLDDANPDLVILDGVAEAMAYDGLDESSNPDVMQWIVRVPRPIAATGAAVVMLDHVKKDADKTERYARGGGAKLAAVDGAAYTVSTLVPFSRQRAGSVGLTCAKDRHGTYSVGETAAVIHVQPSGHGEVVRMHAEPPPDPAAFRPTRIMTRISHLCEDQAMTASGLAGALGRTRPAIIHAAIRALLDDGHLTETRQGSTVLLRTTRPYHGDEPHADDTPPPPPSLPYDDQEDF